VASGDGMAMAYRAGASLSNLEFMQFHPTMLYQPDGESFLISEAVRGHGGVLVNHKGETFVDSLATRDVVARAIVGEMQKSGIECVYLDITSGKAEETRQRFPNISQYCLMLGIDMTRQPIPVVPAAHYMCGGVRTDLHGATGIPGLYAAGEVACTGLHGANRLASNSLLEALVFAKRALLHAAERGAERRGKKIKERLIPAAGGSLEKEVEPLRTRVRRYTWEQVGILRSDAGLAQVCGALDELADLAEELYRRHGCRADLVELRSLATVAQLMAQAARMRKESRGAHFNSDHPTRDDRSWCHDTVLRMAM
jgi:L-aspartate oxidase